MTKNQIVMTSIAIFCVILLIIGFVGGVDKCDDHEWQIKQSVGGNVKIIDSPGWYLKMFATVWEYPRAVQKYWSEDPREGSPVDESIRVTFNDGGTAQMSSMIQYQTPITHDLRRMAHQNFSGSIDSMTNAVRSHLGNCLKNSAPLMSSSEHQSARKAEYRQVVEDQLREGLYKMRRIERILEDQLDENGNPTRLVATEIVLDDDGQPIVTQESPLKQYGLNILQFSITLTGYDDKTIEQFAAKKEFFLLAEKAKAERLGEIQKRLMVVEKGNREKAEVEAEANKEKAKQTIEATMAKEVAETGAAMRVAVAEQDKIEREVVAATQVAVAEQEKLVTETNAQAKVAVATLKVEEAKLNALAADEDAKAIIILAKAEEEKITKAGAITEQERVLAQLQMERDYKVAQALASINVPSIIMSGGGENGNKGNLTEKLVQLKLLEAAGLLDRKTTTTAPSP